MEREGPLARALAGEFDRLIREESEAPFLSPRTLARSVFLYLPRLRTDVEDQDIHGEIRRVAAILRERTSPYQTFAEEPRYRCHSPRELLFKELGEVEARVFWERFHYLASHRDNSRHFALTTPAPESKVAAIATLSEYDLKHVALPRSVSRSEALVLSRVFAFDWAPKNSISYLIGRVAAWCRSALPATKATLTYLNPNVGFDGASYRAANFFLYAYEADTRYVYLDGLYVTDRELRHRFGSVDPACVSAHTASAVEVAADLRPLQIFALPLCPSEIPWLNARGPQTYGRVLS